MEAKIFEDFAVSFVHVSVTVSDVEKARNFYGSVLGLEEAPRPDFGFPGVWYRLGAASQLHIIQNADIRRSVEEVASFTPQYAHYALYTNRVDDLYWRLEKAGLAVHELYSSPTRMRQLFIKDPDGNLIEFIGPSSVSESGNSTLHA
jgi:catechol 2,3-dioxygenase-like lactoylglutathione lyase family enzyme